MKKEYRPSKIEPAAPISKGKDVMEMDDHSSGGVDPPRNAGQIERNSFSKKKSSPLKSPTQSNQSFQEYESGEIAFADPPYFENTERIRQVQRLACSR